MHASRSSPWHRVPLSTACRGLGICCNKLLKLTFSCWHLLSMVFSVAYRSISISIYILTAASAVTQTCSPLLSVVHHFLPSFLLVLLPKCLVWILARRSLTKRQRGKRERRFLLLYLGNQQTSRFVTLAVVIFTKYRVKFSYSIIHAVCFSYTKRW